MNSHLYHLQINIDFQKNFTFYKDFMTFVGWTPIFEANDMAGYKSSEKADLWFVDAQKKELTDYDKMGVNHIAIRVESQKDVDNVVEFIKARGIPPLFETPRHRPDFATSETETYYQVIFETPDKIQVEVVYIGKK